MQIIKINDRYKLKKELVKFLNLYIYVCMYMNNSNCIIVLI